MDADLKKLWDQTLTIIKAEMIEVSFNKHPKKIILN